MRLHSRAVMQLTDVSLSQAAGLVALGAGINWSRSRGTELWLDLPCVQHRARVHAVACKAQGLKVRAAPPRGRKQAQGSAQYGDETTISQARLCS